MITKIYKRVREYCPLFSVIVFTLLPFVIAMHIASVISPIFADFMTIYINGAVRFVLAKITGLFYFSLAEFILIFIPVLIIVAIFISKKFLSLNDPRPARYLVSSLATIVVMFYCLFVLTLGTSYHGTTIDEKLGLDRNDVSAEELLKTSQTLLEGINAQIESIEYNDSNFSVMPYSYSELNDKLNSVYKEVSKEYSFISPLSSNVKRVVLSVPMTYTHISGVYSYFTGEANININFPDYTIPYTMAHEMAHQRGIAREDEANFVAFLVCISSEDAYIKYSGYTAVFEYMISALYSADNTLYRSLMSQTDSRLIGEFVAYNDFFDKYADNVVADVSQSINNSYQQSQGQTAGIKSYGLVVDLAVAYYKSGN